MLSESSEESLKSSKNTTTGGGLYPSIDNTTDTNNQLPKTLVSNSLIDHDRNLNAKAQVKEKQSDGKELKDREVGNTVVTNKALQEKPPDENDPRKSSQTSDSNSRQLMDGGTDNLNSKTEFRKIKPITTNENIIKPSNKGSSKLTNGSGVTPRNKVPSVDNNKDRELVNKTTPGLPYGWQKQVDQKSGKIYYIDHNSKATHWRLPAHIIDTQANIGTDKPTNTVSPPLSRGHTIPNQPASTVPKSLSSGTNGQQQIAIKKPSPKTSESLRQPKTPISNAPPQNQPQPQNQSHPPVQPIPPIVPLISKPQQLTSQHLVKPKSPVNQHPVNLQQQVHQHPVKPQQQQQYPTNPQHQHNQHQVKPQLPQASQPKQSPRPPPPTQNIQPPPTTQNIQPPPPTQNIQPPPPNQTFTNKPLQQKTNTPLTQIPTSHLDAPKQPTLKRSLSSPNLAENMDKLRANKAKTPIVDRMSKPRLA